MEDEFPEYDPVEMWIIWIGLGISLAVVIACLAIAIIFG